MDEATVVKHINETANINNWSLQPDYKKRNTLIKVMLKKAVGEAIICPCKVYVEGFVKPEEVACPCPEAPDDIEKQGSCHCGMFVRLNVRSIDNNS